jgi:hypothetical protein
MSHDSLDAVIAAYMLAVEAGDVPNRQELLDRHLEHADALRAFFADLDRMDRVAAPLRIADGLEATGAADGNGESDLPTVRYFGDYELLEEIARGGMGIVYKARQVSLNRLVALKMILAGSFASSRDIQRFRSEAEAAANLDHPHIVPIYEVGEHEGQQYYSMKFVEGTSLAKYARSDPRTEVEGMVGVVRAVHHAHQRGVLHRDLKPSNVLVDSQGTLLVTDFGLAKRLADADGSITQSGQVLGTPKYMAPEQAAGRKDLTVAADVYSLGVILYERLTGQTPFTGDNALTLLRQARESEPPRPSSIRPGLDRDLETVVLKCLEKEPGRRYPSAEALTCDLDNWLAGRPISARPVGRLEKTWLWARRNPALAAAGGLLAGGLVAVAVLSSIAALQALARAKLERELRQISQLSEAKALADRDTIEKTAARSLIRPLNPDPGNTAETMGGMSMMSVRNPDRLSEPESAALWELAEHSTEQLRLRYLDEATRDPIMLRQLSARSQPALIAALGLDRLRRKTAGRLLDGRLADAAIPREQKLEWAIFALMLAERAGPDTRQWTEMITRFVRSHPNGPSWSNPLVQAASAMEPSVACEVLAAAVIENAEEPLVSALAKAASSIEPVEATRILAEALNQARFLQAPNVASRIMTMNMMGSVNPRATLAAGLAAAARRMEPARGAKVLTEALKRESDAGSRGESAIGLTSVALRLEPAEALRSWVFALEQVKAMNLLNHNTMGAITADHQPQDLAAQVRRLSAVEAAKVCGEVGRSLAATLEKETSGTARRSLTLGLTLVASRMERSEAAKVCGAVARVFATALEKETSTAARRNLALDLSTVASRMAPADAADLCGRAVRFLTAAFEKEKDMEARGLLAYGLSSLSVRLELDDAVKAARLAASAMQDAWAYATGDRDYSFYELLNETMDPADAIRAARVLVTAIGQETDANARWWLCAGLALVAPRMDPKQAAMTCGIVFPEIVAAILRKRTSGSFQGCYNEYMVDGVKAASASAEQAKAGKAARLLVDALNRGVDDDMRRALTRSLASVAGRTSTADADKILSTAIERETDVWLRKELAAELAQVAARIGPAKGTRMLLPSVKHFTEALKHAKNSDGRLQLAAGLARLAEPMEPVQAASILLAAIEKETDAGARQQLLQGLCSVAKGMSPAESSRVLNKAMQDFIQSFRKGPAQFTFLDLKTAIDLLAERMNAEDAANVSARTAQAISEAREKQSDGLLPSWGMRGRTDPLPELVSLAGRMNADEANRTCKGVIRTYLKKSEPTNHAVATALAQLDSACAQDLARELALLLSSLNEVPVSNLDLVLTDYNRSAPIPRNQFPFGAFGGTMSPNPPEKRHPCRLATQELVELLKMPTCFGAARRVVLDHLANRYGRPFVNHWAFVRYANEHRLELDFTTPPKRPDQKKAIERMLNMLDQPDQW